MKTSPYFIDDDPMKILFLDNDPADGRKFFENGMGTVWFDYDIQITNKKEEIEECLTINSTRQRKLDLLLIANSYWFQGGEEFVRQLRAMPAFVHLPVYCVASCNKKFDGPFPGCWNKDWRLETDCDGHAREAARPFRHYLTADHPARLDGIICANSISTELSVIIEKMTSYWFTGSDN